MLTFLCLLELCHLPNFSVLSLVEGYVGWGRMAGGEAPAGVEGPQRLA